MVVAALAGLGARLEVLEVSALPPDEEQVGEWARERAPLSALVCDTRGLELNEALESAWVAVREVAVGALIPGEGAGKVVLLAPAKGPVSAGTENLARTLSVEWARYEVLAVAVAVGSGAEEDELSVLVSFLCSAAGEYFSGCRLEFGALSA